MIYFYHSLQARHLYQRHIYGQPPKSSIFSSKRLVLRTYSLIYNKTCFDRQTVFPFKLQMLCMLLYIICSKYFFYLFKILSIFFKLYRHFSKLACFIFHSFASHWSCLLISQQWQHHFILEPHCQCCQIHTDRIQIWLQHPHEAQHQQHQFDHPWLGCWLTLCNHWTCLGPRGQRGREQFVHQPDNT